MKKTKQAKKTKQENNIKILLAIFLIIAIALLFGSINCTIGSGNVISKQRTIKDFDSVIIKGQGNVYYTQGKLTPLTIKTDDNIMQYVKTTVSGNTLTIDADKCFMKDSSVKIIISSEELKNVKIMGSGKFEALSEITSERLDVATQGSGDIILSGKAKNMNIDISGSGNIKAYNLETKNVNIKIKGSGNIKVNALDFLNIRVMGSGDIYYKGSPMLTRSISGSAKIEKIEESATTPSVPVIKLKAANCTEEQRNINSCIDTYQPVCGQVQVECIAAPCIPVKETFENFCKACKNPRVLSYTKGSCETIK